MSIDWIERASGLRLQVRNIIDGRWVEVGGALLEKYGPRDGKLLCRFGSGESREVDEAVASARRAFDDGRWSKLSTQRRKVVLQKLADLIEGHADELALLECLDVGKPISNAREFDIQVASAVIRFNAEAADKCYGRVYGVDDHSLSYQLRRPLGVVAGIIGWNFPLVLAAAKIGPALASGNSLVLKPSERTSFSASRVAQLALDAGLPEGVLNVVHGGPDVGAMLAKHRAVDLVTFTGSTQTAKKIMQAAAEPNMKRLVLECGGKAPNIVFADCPDLEAVADAVVLRALYNQGEVCTASSRVLVHEPIKGQFTSLLVERAAAAFTPGDPLKCDTTFGALVSDAHKNKVWSYIESGVKEGARKVFQSVAPAPLDGGFYVGPVIFDEVSVAMKIAQEEIFGPVLSVIPFRDESEAIEIANATIYGLSAILWTRDLGRAHRVTQGVQAGWVVVNATARPSGGPAVGVLSVGGHKESGMGIEGGLEGLEEYSSRTAVQIFV